jgi:serine/threonine protein kinase
VIVGTMDFIAPEQTRNAAGVDRRADVYALGCTLYHALTGQVPFPGGHSRDKIRRHRTEEPAPLRSLRPELPAQFAALVHRMMNKDPGLRPSTCREVAEALRSWVGAEQVLPLDEPEDVEYQAALAVAAASADQQPVSSTADLAIADSAETGSTQPWRWASRTFWLALGLALSLMVLLITALMVGQKLERLR